MVSGGCSVSQQLQTEQNAYNVHFFRILLKKRTSVWPPPFDSKAIVLA